MSDVPLVQISYNIEKPWNRFLKRLLDLGLSGLLLISLYPFVHFSSASRSGGRARFVLELPSVLRGRKSLVGPPEAPDATNAHGDRTLHLGKVGLTGLVQLQDDRLLSPEEIEQFNLYYARNQSFLLDVEILIKSAFCRHKAGPVTTGSHAAASECRNPPPRGAKRRAGAKKENRHG